MDSLIYIGVSNKFLRFFRMGALNTQFHKNLWDVFHEIVSVISGTVQVIVFWILSKSDTQ